MTEQTKEYKMEKILMNTKDWKLIDQVRAGKNEGRDQLRNINITADHIEATNGRIAVRLNRAEVSIGEDASKNGVYEIIVAKKYSKTLTELILERTKNVQYPDINKVWPDISGKPTLNVLITSEKKSTFNITGVIIKLFEHTGNGYSSEYLRLLSHFDKTWCAYNMGKNRAVLLKDDKIQILIMPFDIN